MSSTCTGTSISEFFIVFNIRFEYTVKVESKYFAVIKKRQTTTLKILNDTINGSEKKS